jgi:hypothetical protein
MKTIKTMMLTAVLLLVWGCSSDENDNNQSLFGSSPTRPAWKIDWTWHDEAPNWQEPPSTKYWCNMNLLVELLGDFLPYSTDEDQMAVFINGECRGVSYRNVTKEGRVMFVLFVQGDSGESGQPMQLRYYSSGMRQLFVDSSMPPFFPNNLIEEEKYQLTMTPIGNGTKYPVYTDLTVIMPENTPFNVSNDDIMAVFVGDECRGICKRNEELYSGWKGNIHGKQQGETAQVRYFSAEKGGIYTVAQTFTLNNTLQQINISF